MLMRKSKQHLIQLRATNQLHEIKYQLRPPWFYSYYVRYYNDLRSFLAFSPEFSFMALWTGISLLSSLSFYGWIDFKAATSFISVAQPVLSLVVINYVTSIPSSLICKHRSAIFDCLLLWTSITGHTSLLAGRLVNQ